jgi:hypothetical protein
MDHVYRGGYRPSSRTCLGPRILFVHKRMQVALYRDILTAPNYA